MARGTNVLPGNVIGLAVSRGFLIPIILIVIDAVPFEAGALSTSGDSGQSVFSKPLMINDNVNV